MSKNKKRKPSPRKAHRHPRPPRRGVTLGITTRARIADAVHQAVCTVTGSDGFGHCATYAWAGAAVASVTTGHEYMIQAGELLVATGDVNDDGKLYFQYSPALGGYSDLEFHAWFVRRPPAAATGTVAHHSTDHEYVDLSMRHYQHAIRLNGLPWQREPLPPYFWGPWSQLSALDVRLTVDPVMTTRILGRDQEPRREAAELALKILQAA